MLHSGPARSRRHRPAPVILLADAAEEHRCARAGVLRAAGFQIIEAATGSDALRLSMQHRPALAILSVSLPEVDGFSVCKQLKSDPATASVPVLHLSASGRLEDELPVSLENLSDAYLREPVAPETLVATANALIRRRSSDSPQHSQQGETAAGCHAADLLDALADPVVAFDREWRYTYVSRRAAAILGKTPAEMIGKRMWELFPEEAGNGFQEACERAWSECTPVLVECYSEVQNQWCENYIHPFEDGACAQWRDITQSKRFDTALLESQKRLELALDAAELGTWELDVATGAVTASDRTRAIFGFPDSELRVESWKAKLHPADREGATTGFQAAVAGARRYEMEYRIVLEDGSTRWISTTAAPITDPRGTAEKMIGVAQDVTARKRAEENREGERELLQGIVDNIPVMLCTYDPKLQRFDLNPECERLLGWTTADANEGDFMAKVYPDPAYRAAVSEYMQSLAPGWHEIDCTAKDGSVVTSEWANIRLADDRLIGIGIDVRQRKRAEEILRQNEERYRELADSAEFSRRQLESIIDSMSDGLAVFDRSGNLLTVNPAGMKMHGCRDLWVFREMFRREGEVFVCPDQSGNRIHKDRWPLSRSLAGEAVTGFELHFERPDSGQQAVVRYNSVPVRNTAGEIERVVITMQDVTEARRAEQALRESEDRFRTMADNIAQFAWMADETGWLFWYNHRWYEYTGTTLDEMQGWGWQKVHHPDHVARVTERFRRAVEKGEIWEDTFPLRGSDGAYRWFLSRAMPVRDASGRVVRWFGTNTDITERLDTERRLRESEERLRLTLEAAQIGAFEYWPEVDEGFMDAHSRALWSLPDGPLHLRHALDRIHPDDRERVHRTIRQTLLPEASGGYDVEYRVVYPDGSTGWHASRGQAYFEGDGPARHAVRLVGIHIDISERKRAEAALRQSEETARRQLAEIEALYESAPIGLCVLDRDLRWVRVNSRIAAMNGVPREEHIGKTPREVLPDLAEQAEAALRRLMETGQPVLDFEMSGTTAAQPGVVRYWSERWVPLKDSDGTIIGISAAVEEITDKKRAEEALRESEQRERARAAEMEAIMDAVPAATLVARDAEALTIAGNRAAYEIFRVNRGANLSKAAADGPMHFRTMRDGVEIPAAESPIRTAARTGRHLRNIEFDVVFDDGESLHVLGNCVPLFDERGETRGAVAAFLDVSEHKRSEERLRQTQKLESVGLLAGGIAHDFNNLLTGIMGNASLVLEEVGGGPAARIKDVLASAERAAHLTRQLLAYSGKGQFIVRDIDLSEAVTSMGDLVQFSIPKSVELTLNLQKRLPPVKMDPSQLQQIIMNLVINAGEAIGEGKPGRIIVSTGICDLESESTDALGARVPPGRYVCVEVSDTGPGIDDETKLKIFDPFFTTKFTGRGLGLAAVAGIVRAQKGAITLDTQPGRGTTFRVRFPAAARGEHPVQEPENGGRGNILVVDDEPTVREFIGEVLRRHGYRVLTASDGKDALALCDKEHAKVDGMVVDVVMPLMGAKELLPEMKRREPGLKVLLTSGYSESEARRLCAAYPGAAFIQKPYTAQELTSAVNDLLGVAN